MSTFNLIASKTCTLPPGQPGGNIIVCGSMQTVNITDASTVTGFLNCHDGKFYLFVDTLALADLTTVEVLNNTTGNYRVYDFSSLGSSPYGIPAKLGYGKYIITVKTDDGAGDTASYIQTFTMVAPELKSVALNPCTQTLSCNGECSGTLTAIVNAPLVGVCGSANPEFSYCKNELVEVVQAFKYRWQRDGKDIDIQGRVSDIPVWTLKEDTTPMTISTLCAGHYTVFVKQVCILDGCCLESCVVRADAIITQPEPLKVHINTIPGCDGTTILQALAFGGTRCGCKRATCGPCQSEQGRCAPRTERCDCSSSCNVTYPKHVDDGYRYEWIEVCHPNRVLCTSSVFRPSCGGVYEVTVKDSKCCSGRACVTVEQSAISVKVRKTRENKCTFHISVCVKGGSAPYRYRVNGTPIDDDIECYEFSKGKTFCLKVTDRNGRSAETTF